MEELASTALRPLVWDEVRATLDPAERNEVHRIIGSALIEANEDLRKEIHSLGVILAEMKSRNSSARVKQEQGARLVEKPAHFLLKAETANLLSKLDLDPSGNERSVSAVRLCVRAWLHLRHLRPVRVCTLTHACCWCWEPNNKKRIF